MKMAPVFVCFLISVTFGIAEAETKRDFVSRITEVKCSGNTHHIEMVWDSAITPIGPTKFLVDGKDSSDELTMVMGVGSTTYKKGGFKWTIKESDKAKTFTTVANFNGQDFKLNCTSDEKFKFFRSREVVEPTSSNVPSSRARTAP